MEVRDGRDAGSVKATSASQPYRAPRLKVTDTAIAVIRGYEFGDFFDYDYGYTFITPGW